MTLNANIVLDNPILVKHARARLRRRMLVPSISIVVVLCLCIVWLAQTGYVRTGTPLSLMLGLQAILVMVLGSNQIGTTIGKVRETGIIDFHRVSPLPPIWMMVGFLLGPPILEYLLLAITLPFAGWLALDSLFGVVGYVQFLGAILLIGWVMHALVLLMGLATKKPKSSSRGAATVVVMLAIFLGQPIAAGIWFATNRMHTAETLQFFGVELHWLLFVLIYAMPALAMLLTAVTRKLRSDRTHAYTKALAIICQVTTAILAIGAVWHMPVREVSLVVLYLLVLLAMILTVTITPDRGEYLRGIWRAKQVGRHVPSPWSDAGIIRLPLFILCGIVFLATTIILHVSVLDETVATRGSLAIAVGTFVVAYFGLSLQFFLLRAPKGATGIMVLFLFMIWLVPILIGSISAAAQASPRVYQSFLAMSPISGITMASGLIRAQVDSWVRPAAIMPAIGLAVIFNILTVATRRKIDLAARTSSKNPHVERER